MSNDIEKVEEIDSKFQHTFEAESSEEILVTLKTVVALKTSLKKIQVLVRS